MMIRVLKLVAILAAIALVAWQVYAVATWETTSW